ncbi:MULTISPECIES: GNAT family N-acetyltransferase [unclassified Streptomyces]|uniref:GNAT family N-acetyltransferase n=1 Tax=unclassified Streptomyces TaxID=2593676 RepID=UPI001BE61C42|nr:MULTISPECIES: GNAT family protein [unclassified Streptomyces]MBT2404586.1 GNAT family N-acetyltransferase [Streptomyces sp. ISL-21]MBT2610468.1 GNAT family N-acetyltransferase [Streptomyces sp. ISL-87]
MIESPRLLLRRFRPDDAPALGAYRSDPDIARYQVWPSPLTPAEAAETVRRHAEAQPENPGWFQYAIELKADSTLIGDLGVNLHENRLQADIGFTLAAAHHGHGYATEAVQAVVGHLVARGLHRFGAYCDARNTASIRVLERTGFRREGHGIEAVLVRGEWTDSYTFGLLARHWKAPSAISGAARGYRPR